jgi:hypothetical protein
MPSAQISGTLQLCGHGHSIERLPGEQSRTPSPWQLEQYGSIQSGRRAGFAVAHAAMLHRMMSIGCIMFHR